ncbi:hypothetical protein [Nocardia nova]|uniref:hypothetical protein n=1 Tax=Nocardia nova TaxID=37330 RepID=UPI001896030A|nr:hypothetical protein [Nocardia nova]MBF6150279.1 hypothetical protein [Nocardia nova]
MSAEFARTEAATARALGRIFSALPWQVQAALLVFGLLLGMVGCSAAWIDQQGYEPSPSICRADEVTRTDCVHVVRPTQPDPAATGWDQ